MTDWKDYVFPQFQYFYGERSIKGMDDMITRIQPEIMRNNVDVLDDYADNSFRVGNSKTFKEISNDFNDTIEGKYKEIQTYLSQSIATINEVRELMSKDRDAQIAAKAKYNEFKENNKLNYLKEVTNDDGSTSMKVDEDALDKAASAAADDVWDSEKSAVWN